MSRGSREIRLKKTSTTTKPSYIDHRKRLKERYLKAGMEALADYEAIELLLTYAIPLKDVKPLAKRLIETFGSYEGVLDADTERLCEVDGIGSHTAILLKLVRDVMARYHLKEARKQYQVSGTPDLVRYCRLQMAHLGDEQFRVLFLNNQNRIIRDEVLQEGTVDRAEVYPRKILEKALKYKASAMILVHNHPSGSPDPSEQDKKLTKTLVKTARDLGIAVHDHMIIAQGSVFSFREEGLMRGN